MGKVFVVPMSVTTTQYTRKPLNVAAVRVTGGNFEEIAAWCQGEILQDEAPDQGTGKQYIHVRVHNPKNPRQTKAYVGDWLLYTERGYKIYTNKAFHASFDETQDKPLEYPYNDNGTTVLGPECFVQRDGEVLCWKGVNYVPQTTHEDVYMGNEEILPGITVNDAVKAVDAAKAVERAALREEEAEKAV